MKHHVKKNRCLLIIIIIGILSVSCSKPTVETEEKKEAYPIIEESFAYGDFSVKDGLIYSSNILNLFEGYGTLPVETNYFCIKDDEIFYVNQIIGTETGEVSHPEACYIMKCNMDGISQEKLIELKDASYIGKILLQGSLIYYSYITVSDELIREIYDYKNNLSWQIQNIDGLSNIAAFDSDYIYYNNYSDSSIYRCRYDGSENKIIKEADFNEREDGNIQNVIKAGDKFYAVECKKGKYVLISFQADGSEINEYQDVQIEWNSSGNYFLLSNEIYYIADDDVYSYNIDDDVVSKIGSILDDNVQILNTELLCVDDKWIYYLVFGKIDEGIENSFIYRMSLENGVKKMIGKWYTP